MTEQVKLSEQVINIEMILWRKKTSYQYRNDSVEEENKLSI